MKEYVLTAEDLQAILLVLSALPYNTPVSNGRCTGDLVNLIRSLEPVKEKTSDDSAVS